MTQRRSGNTGYRHILVATDFFAHAEAAVRQAVWLARKVGARITLAHTLPDWQHGGEGARQVRL